VTVEALKKMATMGLTLEQAIEIMEAMETKPARSANAERQARFRAKRRESVTGNVTCGVTDNVTAPPSPPPETKAVSPAPPSVKTQTTTLAPTPPIVPPAPRSDFDLFWSAYPRKVAKADAAKAFDRARKRANLSAVLDGLDRCLPIWAQTDREFIPHPATWLNRDGWLDELTPPSPRPKSFLEIDRERDDAQNRGALLALEIMKERDRRNERSSQNCQPVGPGPALPEIVPDGAGTGALVVGLSDRLARRWA
jgi:hypothetical protein